MNKKLSLSLSLALLAVSIICRAETNQILLIGDSHSEGPFGETLTQEIRKQPGTQVTRYGLVGASPRHYFQISPEQRTLKMGFVEDLNGKISRAKVGTAPNISDLVSRISPKHVVIELGENLYDYKSGQLHEKLWQNEVTKLLSKIPANIPCTWVLPTWTNQEKRPPYQKSNAYLKLANEKMKSFIGDRCQVISGTEITELTPENIETVKGDWLHQQKGSGERWARAVLNRMNLKQTSNQKTAIPATKKDSAK